MIVRARIPSTRLIIRCSPSSSSPCCRDLLAALLVDETGDRSGAVRLELNEVRPSMAEREAGARPGDEDKLRIGSRLRDQHRPVAANGYDGPGPRLVLTHVALQRG